MGQISMKIIRLPGSVQGENQHLSLACLAGPGLLPPMAPAQGAPFVLPSLTYPEAPPELVTRGCQDPASVTQGCSRPAE